MVRWLLLVLSFLLCALASLTVLRAPTLLTWKLAIMAGEFGQFLWLLPMFVGMAAYFRDRSGEGPLLAGVTVALSLASALGFLWPSYQASQLANTLPARLDQAFGPAKLERLPYEFFYFGSAKDARAIEPETKVFAYGGTNDALSLDFYRAVVDPRLKPAPRPCVIVIHGGGWDNGTRDQLTKLNSSLANRGYAVANMDYRLAPRFRWPAQREDLLAAITYLKTNASALGIDPQRFVLLGRSAGGQIAETVAYQNPDPAIRGVIALYAPADLIFAWKYAREDDVLNSFLLLKQYTGGTPDSASAQYHDASAYFHVNHATLPTLLIHGKLDTLVWHKQSERLDVRLTEEHVPHVFVSLPWATHACDFTLSGPSGQLSTFAIESFLAAVVP